QRDVGAAPHSRIRRSLRCLQADHTRFRSPPVAHAALEAEPELGTLLLCNVVVYQEQGRTHIAAIDAERMLSIVGNDQLADTAGEVRRRLSAVVDRAAQR